MVNFNPLTAEIGWRVWSTSANFNGFRVLASLLHRCRSTEVNQTLHDVWLSPKLVHYLYTFGGSCSVTEFCQVQNSLCVQVLRSAILTALTYCTTFVQQHSTEGSTYIRRAAITLGIGPHSSFLIFCRNAVWVMDPGGPKEACIR